MIRISQSKVKLWRQCKYAYGLKYVDNLKANTKSRPLKFGTIVHKMLEADAEGDDPFAKLDEIGKVEGKLFKAEVEMYGEIVEDIRNIMKGYFAYYEPNHGMQKAQALEPVRVNKKNAEHKFEIELVKGEILFTGKIDMFARKAASKLNWLTEHKTFKRKPSTDHRWRNIQSCVYHRATDIMGWIKLSGTVWDYINSKPPTIPEIVSKGTRLSRKKITTLPHVVENFLIANEVPVLDYADFIQDVANSQLDYFERVFTPIKKTVVDFMYEEFTASAIEISQLQGKVRTRNIALHCDYCDYEPICRAALLGQDVEHVKAREFHINKDEYDEAPLLDE